MGVRLLSPPRFFFQVKQRFLAHNVNQCEIRLNKFKNTKEKLNFWSPKRIKVTEFCLKLTAGAQGRVRGKSSVWVEKIKQTSTTKQIVGIYIKFKCKLFIMTNK